METIGTEKIEIDLSLVTPVYLYKADYSNESDTLCREYWEISGDPQVYLHELATIAQFELLEISKDYDLMFEVFENDFVWLKEGLCQLKGRELTPVLIEEAKIHFVDS